LKRKYNKIREVIDNLRFGNFSNKATKDAFTYSLLFVFVSLGIYTSIYMRDSVTGYAVFTNNNSGFDFFSLLFIGILVFVGYLYVHKE